MEGRHVGWKSLRKGKVMDQLAVSSPASLRRLVKAEKGRSNGVAATTKGELSVDSNALFPKVLLRKFWYKTCWRALLCHHTQLKHSSTTELEAHLFLTKHSENRFSDFNHIIVGRPPNIEPGYLLRQPRLKSPRWKERIRLSIRLLPAGIKSSLICQNLQIVRTFKLPLKPSELKVKLDQVYWAKVRYSCPCPCPPCPCPP